MAKQTVALYTVTSGDRVSRARDNLAEALGDAQLGDVDDAGTFEVAVDAESPEAARELVREAFARAGTGGDFVIQEGAEGREMPEGDPRQAGAAEVLTTAVGAGEGSSPGEGSSAADSPEGASSGDASPGAGEEGGAGAGGGSPDRASSIADAASAVAAAASSARAGDGDAARDAAEQAASAARTAAAEAAEAVRQAASSAREAVDEKGVAGAASDYAGGAASAAQGRDWSKFAPIGAGIFLLLVLRRMRR